MFFSPIIEKQNLFLLNKLGKQCTLIHYNHLVGTTASWTITSLSNSIKRVVAVNACDRSVITHCGKTDIRILYEYIMLCRSWIIGIRLGATEPLSILSNSTLNWINISDGDIFVCITAADSLFGNIHWVIWRLLKSHKVHCTGFK